MRRRKAKVLVPPELVNYDNLGKIAMMIDQIGQALGSDAELVHKRQGRKHEIIFREKNGSAATSDSTPSPVDKPAPVPFKGDRVSEPFGGKKKSAKPYGSRRWSEQEENLLIEYMLNNWSDKMIGDELKRTPASIRTRASILRTEGRVPEKAPSREGKEWTKDEDKLLLKLQRQRMSFGQIAVRMGRTPRAVSNRHWALFKAGQRNISIERQDMEGD